VPRHVVPGSIPSGIWRRAALRTGYQPLPQWPDTRLAAAATGAGPLGQPDCPAFVPTASCPVDTNASSSFRNGALTAISASIPDAWPDPGDPGGSCRDATDPGGLPMVG